MENEIVNLLKDLLARQVVLYKKLDSIERKLNGSTRFADIQSYADELTRESSKIKN